MSSEHSCRAQELQREAAADHGTAGKQHKGMGTWLVRVAKSRVFLRVRSCPNGALSGRMDATVADKSDLPRVEAALNPAKGDLSRARPPG